MSIKDYRTSFTEYQQGKIVAQHILSKPADTKYQPKLTEQGKVQLTDALLKASKHQGTAVAFCGHSKSNITILLNIIASKLGKAICLVDCQLLADKYIGETEKNLSQIVAEAESKGWVLFFDEADALFENHQDSRSHEHKGAPSKIQHLLNRIGQNPSLNIISTNRQEIISSVEHRVDYII